MSIFSPVNKYKEIVPEIFEDIPKPPTHSKVIIIGSGFGGAVSAWRLAQAGIASTILERGSYWPISKDRKTFTDEVLPDGRGFWHRQHVKQLNGFPAVIDDFGGVMDVTSYDHIDVWRGACVGGGSVVYTGVMIQPKQKYFDQLFQGVVDYSEMDQKYYPLVRQVLNLNSMPEDIYQSKPFGHSRTWDSQSQKAGYQPYRVDSVFNWDIIYKELNNEVRASAIVGETDLGNSNGAKFDLTQNYLKYAQDSGFSTVYPGHQVQTISYNGKNYEVKVTKLNPQGDVLDTYMLTCDYLFLAAGSIGTSELLVKAKALNTLPALNEHIGQGWGSNGDAIVVRSFSGSEGLTQGSACASKIDDETIAQIPVTLENWFTPGIAVNIGVAGSLGMTFDETRANFVYNSKTGDVELQWRKTDSDKTEEAIRMINNKIAKASGSVPGLFPLSTDVRADFTAHPLGGAVIGKATDAYGRIKNYSNLYVIDGALMPGSAGLVNPSLTIAALAERNIETIIQKDF
ncbi:GMC oxidoreductase [Commensalibacter oyaizuii]|uniref:Cholesterol oxidase n=1 Tax=Commensalibacter oyaizuii TaxID=3043873 RepID=A0ABT6Q169_9PROT|nr:GMC oxidoreductase [Commensalibacter sp. TBRC 16381]MDI2090834.1 GMC oxidoreductase [Commensalibacter sp. TBRC 16381]